MRQNSLGLSNIVKRARKCEFLDAMELVVLWGELVALIEPYARASGRRGQQPLQCIRCCAFISCSNGSSSAIRRWKKYCTTCQPFGTSQAVPMGRPHPQRFEHLAVQAFFDYGQCAAASQRTVTQSGHRRGCHADCSDHDHQERRHGA